MNNRFREISNAIRRKINHRDKTVQVHGNIMPCRHRPWNAGAAHPEDREISFPERKAILGSCLGPYRRPHCARGKGPDILSASRPRSVLSRLLQHKWLRHPVAQDVGGLFGLFQRR